MILLAYVTSWASQVAVEVKNSPASVGDIRDDASTPGLVRSPGGEHGNSIQYSFLENSIFHSYNPLGHKELGLPEAT